MITVGTVIMELTGILHISMVVAVDVAATVVIAAAVIALVIPETTDGKPAVLVVTVVTVLMDVLIVQTVVARMEALVANKNVGLS